MLGFTLSVIQKYLIAVLKSLWRCAVKSFTPLSETRVRPMHVRGTDRDENKLLVLGDDIS